MKSAILSLALAVTAFIPLAAQAAPAKPATGAYQAPRTADGRPDLQGIWTNATITPLERPADFKDLVISEADAARMEKANAQANTEANRQSDPKAKVTDLPVDCGRGFKGVDCGYNNFWIDPGTKVITLGGEKRSSIIVEPKAGRLPPLTAAGRTRMAARFNRNNPHAFDGPEARSLGERCLMSFGSSAGPPMLPLLYNNTYQIVQAGDEVMILVEMVHDVRVIRVGARHLPPSIKPWMGDSVGRWEGDTLVVETTNFRPDQGFRGGTGDMKVTERLTRVAPDKILYRFTVDDPATYTQPFSGEVAMNATKGPIYEYACHEGNYALPGILGGARALEKQGRTPTSNPTEGEGEGG